MLMKSDGYDNYAPSLDTQMMERCIRLSEISIEQGELPFGALICRDEAIVAETTNQVINDADITRHAEIVAISKAQKILGHRDLTGCTLYSTVEPCVMCAYAVREARVSRVVFSIRSPLMGGLSKWNVLRDSELSHHLPEVFGSVPEVVSGLLRREAERVWSAWNPLFWSAIKFNGYMGGEEKSDCSHLPAIPGRRGLLRRIFALHGRRHA